jgi:hypothetical protein
MPGEVSSDEIRRVRKNAKRTRAFVACVRCKVAKIKCSGYRPCKRCCDSNVACCFDVACESTSQESKAQHWKDPASVTSFQSWSHLQNDSSQGSMVNHCTMGYGPSSCGQVSRQDYRGTTDIYNYDGYISASRSSITPNEMKWMTSPILQSSKSAQDNHPSCWTFQSPGDMRFVKPWPPPTAILPDLLQTLRSL